jgi:hypothetical protein
MFLISFILTLLQYRSQRMKKNPSPKRMKKMMKMEIFILHHHKMKMRMWRSYSDLMSEITIKCSKYLRLNEEGVGHPKSHQPINNSKYSFKMNQAKMWNRRVAAVSQTRKVISAYIILMHD